MVKATNMKIRSYCDFHKKTRYETRKIAARRAKIHGKNHKRKLYVYQCPACNGWHLTKKNNRA